MKKTKTKPKKKIVNRLRCDREWGCDLYFVGRRRVESLKEVQIGTKRYRVVSSSVSETIYDMGHTYEASSRHYYVVTKVFGLRMELDLNEIAHRTVVIATKFTLRDKNS